MPAARHGDSSPAPGLLFDQFDLGRSFQSPTRRIDQPDIDAFAELSGDFNPLHTDAEFAARSVFRSRIAHGLLVQSVASGLAWQLGIFNGTIAALTDMVIEFQSPVIPGDEVRLELTVAAKDPAPSVRRGWIRFDARVLNQRQEIVIQGSWTTLMLRKADRRRELTRESANG
ncbi:MAG: MaoC/PaaZ C-terminal domain-containing protein [Planctomycetota bacterium]